MSLVRTRIAPSPTGQDIHIGNLYTALINWAYAKKNNGQFIVRIEDTDRERYVKGAEEKILASLHAFSITNDEGPDVGGPYAPYRQSERLPIYKQYAEELIAKGKAYYCFCSKERLEELRLEQQKNKHIPRYDKHCLLNVKNAKERIEGGEKYVVRLNVTPDKKVWFDDVIRGKIEFDSSQIDDQVLLKSDGYPTYHLGVVVDDYLMKISHVVRAEEWISSTPKHVILYESFGWPLPIFAHMPILRNPDKSKLSKRKNPVWASWYLDEGYLPEAILNFLALQGWSHPDGKELFSVAEFIEKIDLKDIHPAGPIFDSNKLQWMNQQYIQTLDNTSLKNKLATFYKDSQTIYGFLSNSKASETVVELAKTRMKTLKDFASLVHYLFEPPRKDMMSKEHIQVIPLIRTALEQVTLWTSGEILAVLKEIMSKQSSAKMSLFYVLFTGNKQGLPLPEMLEVLGKDEVLKRLENLQK